MNDPEALFCQDCGEPLEARKDGHAQKNELVCPACSTVNPPQTRFCRMCGVRLTEWEPESSAKRDRISCPVCGKPTPAGFAFCQFCGSRIGTEEHEEGGLVEPTPPAGLPRPVTAPLDVIVPPAGWDKKQQAAASGDLGQVRTAPAEPKATAARSGQNKVDLLAQQTREISAAETDALKKLTADTNSAPPSKSPPDRPAAADPHKTALNFSGAVAPQKRPAPQAAQTPQAAQAPPETVAAPKTETSKPAAAADSAPPQAKGVLRLHTQSGGRAQSWEVDALPFDIGRSTGQLRLPDDPTVSARHARIVSKEKGFLVRDLGSINGVYRAIQSPEPLLDGDQFILGERVFRFEWIDPETEATHPALEEEVELLGTPADTAWAKLKDLSCTGTVRTVYYCTADRIVVGRNRAHLCFPDDASLAPAHATLQKTAEGFLLSAAVPQHAVFLRVRGAQVLAHGDRLCIGRSVLRVEISPQGG
jgi:pSer/pThr/pTyr-binding forkhead associated (FHA) protein